MPVQLWVGCSHPGCSRPLVPFPYSLESPPVPHLPRGTAGVASLGTCWLLSKGAKWAMLLSHQVKEKQHCNPLHFFFFSYQRNDASRSRDAFLGKCQKAFHVWGRFTSCQGICFLTSRLSIFFYSRGSRTQLSKMLCATFCV